MVNIIRQRSIESLLLNIIGFLLVFEWLNPLESIANVNNLSVFVCFLAICFLFSYLRLHWSISLVVNVVYVTTILHYFYFQKSFLALFWPARIVEDIFRNIKILFNGEWMSITDSFRTLLMFVLLWLLVYLLHYWIVVQKNILFFFLLTVIYLSIIDTFAAYNATFAILRTVIIGFFALGILTFYRFVEKEQLSMKNIVKKRWIIALVGVIIISSFVGVLVPKAGPIWPDPVPFFQSFADHHEDNGSGSGVRKIGYDTDDTNLGGPFVGDKRVVFTVTSENKEYWRVETKDLYTGKGWELSARDDIEFVDGNVREVPIYSVEDALLSEENSSVSIDLADNRTHLIYPQGITNIYFNEENIYQVNHTNEKISTSYLSSLSNYEISYRKPSFEVYTLRKAIDTTGVDQEFLARYTQVPDNLPTRIQELAVSITAGAENLYDKAKAIESYLNSYRFTYDTQNVAIPKEEQDYVDQFLFETMVGYCDNFSSSMVVLLRTIGIPARWAKGYTPGNEIQTNDTFSVYEVTNNNAHSWVEVFFPEIGWVPFEPTKGFENPAEFYYNLDNRPEQTDSETSEPATPEQEEPKEKPEANNTSAPDKADASIFSLEAVAKFAKTWLLGAIVVIGILAGIVFLFRKRLYPYWLQFKYKNKTDNKSFATAYLSLIRQLQWNGFIRKEGETLRSFAQYVDHFLESNSMSRLTNQYERILYRNEIDGNDWEEIRMDWDKILRLLNERN
ncbi:DUF3488 and transglutaminase-like domain-containing protein [Caldibacillus lycopersici]|uniref:DUF3488 and transglutaminase-like domain-containing protein n=1 Tax=Perspicuibacillus lycopersici TaxID=1325689 RepID=A0AAE3IYN0_9BACI|nr:DUF3488 and transglutaminase-like domain-containing protein [Perspicuibacillus lycopersici]MCU9615344.1 DUF3488 and transglutaminase-like domain-containing protein [Perspicuibacillus lycopersici]